MREKYRTYTCEAAAKMYEVVSLFKISFWTCSSLVLYVWIRMRPFRLNFFLLISEVKWNWIRLACVSLVYFKNSGLFFASFRFKYFAWLHLSYVRFEAKRRANLFFALNISFHLKKPTFFTFFCFAIFVSYII